MGHLEPRTPLGLVGKTRFPRDGTKQPYLGQSARTHFQRSKRRRRQSGVGRSSVRVGRITERMRFWFPAVNRTDRAPQRVPTRSTGSNESREQLDSVDLREVLLRVPMLKSCPQFLRGWLLRERHNCLGWSQHCCSTKQKTVDWSQERVIAIPQR